MQCASPRSTPFTSGALRRIDNVRRERAELPQLDAWHGLLESTLDALVDEAIQPYDVNKATVRVMRALIDIAIWTALKEQGLTDTQANRTVSEFITHVLRKIGLVRTTFVMVTQDQPPRR